MPESNSPRPPDGEPLADNSSTFRINTSGDGASQDVGSPNVERTLLGNCELIGLIGEGGMGVVYKYHQPFLRKDYAVKRLKMQKVSSEVQIRFQREALAASSLHHENLVSVHDFGLTSDEQPYMVMDFVEGSTLKEAISGKLNLTLSEKLSIVIQCCDGLQHAHDQGICHRDLKPTNIMLTHLERAVPQVKILDFGIAKMMDLEGSVELTKTGEIFGSPLYMSPEQANGGKTDQRTDLYSLGCVLFEALTGTPPFAGQATLSILVKHLNEKPPTLREATLGGDFPEALENCVAKLLAKDPADRYQTMSALKTDLLTIQKEVENPSRTRPIVPDKAQRIAKSLLPKSSVVAAVIGTIAILAIASIWVILNVGQDTKPQPVSVAVESDLVLEVGEKYAEQNSAKRNSDIVAHAINASRRNGNGYCEIDNQPLTSADFQRLGESAHISVLALMGCTGFTPQGIRQISKLHLQQLSLVRAALSDECLAELASSPELLLLDISDRRNVTRKGFSQIGNLKTLRTLIMARTSVDNSALKKIVTLPALRHINLTDCREIRDSSLKIIAGATNRQIDSFNLTGTQVTADGVQALSSLPLLHQLDLSNNVDITDAAVRPLARIKYLHSLGLKETSCTPACVNYLKGLPEFTLLDISGQVPFTQKDLARMKKVLPKCKVAVPGLD